MSLILAVEPDRRQAAHLTHIVRQRVGAEMILAETTELALASIGNRVPDLILVPALLSPQDDAALAAALRVIATAAHVQMLTTPLFASAAPEPRRGVLAVFRRSKPAKASIDGCDPAEFAQQISSYLESAAEERAAAVQFVEQPAQAPAVPVAETRQPYAPLEAGRLYRDEAVSHREIETAPAPEAASESAFALPEPEPVAEFAEPVVTLEAAPLIDDSAPATYESIQAISSETPDAEAIAGAVETLQEPILETPEPIFKAPEPIFETPEPIFETPEPIFETPEPIFETPEPIFETPEPIFETPEPVETPEPLAATDSTRSRRIGFIVREEETEPEFAADFAEPFGVEAYPVEIAASVETASTIEAIAEQEPIEAFSEPVFDGTIELFEVVDEDDQEAVGTIDLSGDFEDLQVVEAVEIAADETEAVEILEATEILETPAFIEAVEPAAPQMHAIKVDALQEFAAAVEALTAAEPIASNRATGKPIEFEDLFPPREPVEPSPLGAWRSWATLEGMAAEDAPVPAHVMGRAVERAPERPEWVQLVESLRIDVERRRSEQPSVAPIPVRKTPSRPIQDEWGLFDPAQCGFAALLDKLDEITDATEPRPRRSA
jgi:hypothetical protein